MSTIQISLISSHFLKPEVRGYFKKHNLLLIILFSIILGCDLNSAEDYLNIANGFEKQSRYSEAISTLDKGYKSYPKDIRILIGRAHYKSMNNEFIESIKDDSLALLLDPNNILVLVNRGKCKERIQDFNGAIQDFNKAILQKGGERSYFEKVPNSFVETGFEFDVRMEEIKFERAICYYYQDSLRRAFDDFNFSIQNNFALSDSYFWRGLIYIRYDMKNEGCMDLEKSKNLGDPDAVEQYDKYWKQ
jgi:tetratricopeptide (TPR) repeat protein